ncbi:conserved hypothetical protein [Neospora caninum Liverpool]|uniref:ER membrane protein complex subunit 4 n=1 Tax=Neospora caninum (strain Liverpool) TaxID=572307 RepID=F0VGW6_NEOCL|nr:conserved hypothetical protein [Neospora caninum Liverpool]CBZ52960.1 conserved hypothetical protein [Neospora caninum Liverpool]CEL66945.1 TPA: hypothetical protein BN1204_027490 [Neospora caninum Liverpool]|eukprot:XP_003882992.1 conserved hypothetical protein [Neospora caninum Liverpool]
MEKPSAESAASALSCWTFSLDSTASTARSRGNMPPPISLPSPPGFSFTESAAASSGPTVSSRGLPAASRVEAARRQHLLAKKGWEIAISPAKNLAMNFFMIYMGGVNSSGIFGILILFYVLHSCFSSALNVNRVFAGLEQDREALGACASSVSSVSASSGRSRDLAQDANWSLRAVFFLQKTVYLLISLGGCLYVLNHCMKAGLLPLNSGDFIALIPEKRFSVVAMGGL